MQVYIMLTVAIAAIIWYIVINESKKKKNAIAEKEGVLVFGENIPMQDYLSLCNTCIAYLICSPTKKVDMTLFIAKDKFQTDDYKSSMLMLRDSINKFPIIQCNWSGGTILEVDEMGTIKKIETYQKATQSDDYIIPLFDLGLIARNPKLFSTSTKYQQAKTAQDVMTARTVTLSKDPATEVVEQSIAKMYDDKFITPVVFKSPRHLKCMDAEPMVVSVIRK